MCVRPLPRAAVAPCFPGLALPPCAHAICPAARSIEVKLTKKALPAAAQPATPPAGATPAVPFLEFTAAGEGLNICQGVPLIGEPLRRSVVAGLPIEAFHELLEGSIAFNRFMLNQLNERLGQFIAAREIDRISDPELRVARNLAALFHPQLYPGVGSLLRITQQQDLASAMRDVGSLLSYVLRLLVGVHVWSFRKPDAAPPREPQ
jgi:hypothetical protein